MKKHTRSRFSRTTVLSGSLLLLVVMAVVSSCSGTKSVREIRQNRGENGDFTKSYKGGNTDIMTKGLFMQNSHPFVELPNTEAFQIDPNTGSVMVSEIVTFTNADNRRVEKFDNTDINADTVYSLNEVTVTATSRFTPEHDGQIAVDFMVQVPRAIISPSWRLTLEPKLIDGDSIVKLPHIIVKGEDFAKFQKEGYKAYHDYRSSIIDESAYDSVYLERDLVNKDIRVRQDYYYKQYREEWNKQMAYEKWRKGEEDRNEKYMIEQKGLRDEMFHSYARKANDESFRLSAAGKDTTGVYAKHMKFYKSDADKLMSKWEARTYRNIPKEFAEIHKSGRTLQDVYNDYMTKSDSVKIAEHRYDFGGIAENELRAARAADRFQQMVPYPYEENVRDSIIITPATTDKSVSYYYKQSYPVRIGMKKLRIMMESKVNAVDMSSYDLRPSDTIDYLIASLSQLIDMSGTHTETVLYRDLKNEMTIYPKFAANKTDFEIDYKDNRDQISKFMETYNVFMKETGLVLDSLEITTSTSLSGEFEKNIEKTMKRSNSIKDFLARNYPSDIDQGAVRTYYKGEDWNTMANMINRSSLIKNKAEIVKLLSEAVSPDQTEKDLRRLYASDFKVITDSIYPKLEKLDIVFQMHRPNMASGREVKRDERPGYDKAIQLMLDRDYWKAIDILADYADYNTALCLVSMGYNAKGLEILEKLKPNGYTEYLLAILAIRMDKDENKAVEHLKEAVRLDPTKIYRVPLDPEMSMLVRKFNLNLQQIANEAAPATDATAATTAK